MITGFGFRVTSPDNADDINGRERRVKAENDFIFDVIDVVVVVETGVLYFFSSCYYEVMRMVSNNSIFPRPYNYCTRLICRMTTTVLAGGVLAMHLLCRTADDIDSDSFDAYFYD